MSKYRVVRDRYLGFEVQCRRWWFPVWLECHDRPLICNSHMSIEKAVQFAARKKGQPLRIDEWRLS